MNQATVFSSPATESRANLLGLRGLKAKERSPRPGTSSHWKIRRGDSSRARLLFESPGWACQGTFQSHGSSDTVPADTGIFSLTLSLGVTQGAWVGMTNLGPDRTVALTGHEVLGKRSNFIESVFSSEKQVSVN